MAKKITIRDLKHRIAICSMKDVVTKDGVMVLVREDVTQMWAKVETRSSSFASAPMFGQAGYAILENRDRQSHVITTRFRPDLDITSAAWIYEERLQSGARWFKVLGIREVDDAQFLAMSCRLVERGDDLTPPIPETAEPIKIVENPVRL